MTDHPPIPYAGLGVRSLAMIIDMVIATPVFIACSFIPNQQLSDGIFILLMVVAYSGFFASKWQATPGMRMLQVHIETTECGRLSLARAVWWCVVSAAGVAISFIGLIYVQWRFDLETIQQKLIEAQMNRGGGLEASMAEFETLTGVPYEVFTALLMGSLLLTLALSVIWILSIMLGKQKAGFHNWICGTRFVKGRPGA